MSSPANDWRTLRVRQWEPTRYWVQSQTRKNVEHLVDAEDWTCSCEWSEFHKEGEQITWCAHIKRVRLWLGTKARSMDKKQLAEFGEKRARAMCELNGWNSPTFTVVESDERIVRMKAAGTATCGFYRPMSLRCRGPEIVVSWRHCAHVGTAGSSWSFPGYVIDRTPYGVVQHELGHYALGSFHRNFNGEIIMADAIKDEEPISGYAPNPEEKCVEMFRLYVTNPNLLSLIRPRAFEWLAKRVKPIEHREWQEVLRNAPERTIAQALKKIGAALP